MITKIYTLFISVSIILIMTVSFSVCKNEKSNEITTLTEFNNCLAKKGVTIYGTKRCGHCINLVEIMGGYDAVKSVYVECTAERERCKENMKTNRVPEIQINGELYKKARTLEDLSSATGCSVPEIVKVEGENDED